MMEYTIREVAEKMNLTTSTIRYYESEGLLPNIKRKESGYRIFTDADMGLLQLIDCFKKTGLSIKEIKHFCQLTQQGDASLQERYELFDRHKAVVEAQIAEMYELLALVNHKREYYQVALAAGTEAVHKK